MNAAEAMVSISDGERIVMRAVRRSTMAAELS